MAAFQWILLLCSVALLSVAARKSQRTKRGMTELAGTIKCSTGLFAGDYSMYGCYCGLEGQGWPKDQADWCCFRHDCCYGEAQRLQGCEIRTTAYRWTCKNHTPECADLEGTCEKMLCRCDKVLADCLREAPYHLSLVMWPDFLCTQKPPQCPVQFQTQDGS